MRRAGGNSRAAYILGISCFFHDAAAALVTDGFQWRLRRRSASPCSHSVPTSLLSASRLSETRTWAAVCHLFR